MGIQSDKNASSREITMSHFSAQERELINDFLARGAAIGEIAAELHRDRTSICREIRRNRTVTCEATLTCPRLARPPFVCNGCPEENTGRKGCMLPKILYSPHAAQENYRQRLSESRQGINLTEGEIRQIDDILAAGLEKGQSPHHIMLAHRDEFTICEKSVYRLIQAKAFRMTRRWMLPEATKRKPRKSKARQHKVDAYCAVGRSYEDFLAYQQENPGAIPVEMDSIIGRRGGKALLTMNFNSCGLMMAFLRERNNAKSVRDIFDMLEDTLGAQTFRRLFPVILTDNGSEFSDPVALETPGFGKPRTRIFYCHPYSAYEKPCVENNNRTFRRIFNKGATFDDLDQDDVNLAMSHVNSYCRKEYGDIPAVRRFETLYGDNILGKLGIHLIEPDKILLSPKLIGEMRLGL
mgnify:CR=1 FL=1